MGLIPRSVHASVVITEVAYAGTQNSQYEEWIELFNDGEEDSDISGWSLIKAETTSLFALSGNIPPGGYRTVCRTTGTLTNPLDGACSLHGAFGGSGLSNIGEHLVLKDEQGSVIDEIALVDGKWPVSGVAKGESMQKIGDHWIKGVPTPNSGSVGTEEQEVPSQNSSATSSTTAASKDDVEFVKPDPKYSAKVISPDNGTAGVAVPFKVSVTQDGKKDLVSGKFEWSMGDGSSYVYASNTPIDHIFYYPGEYTITLVYYSNNFKQEPDSVHRKKITIVPHSITIAGLTDDGGTMLQNQASKDIALDGWSLRQGSITFTFPRYTFITKGSMLAISSRTLGFVADEQVQLLNPSGLIIARYEQEESVNVIADNERETPAAPTAVTVQPQPDAETPRLKTIPDLWKEYRWHVIAVATGVVIVLAYFGVTLYATRNEFL
jgi:hypothetical protein